MYNKQLLQTTTITNTIITTTTITNQPLQTIITNNYYNHNTIYGCIIINNRSNKK